MRRLIACVLAVVTLGGLAACRPLTEAGNAPTDTVIVLDAEVIDDGETSLNGFDGTNEGVRVIYDLSTRSECPVARGESHQTGVESPPVARSFRISASCAGHPVYIRWHVGLTGAAMVSGHVTKRRTLNCHITKDDPYPDGPTIAAAGATWVKGTPVPKYLTADCVATVTV